MLMSTCALFFGALLDPKSRWGSMTDWFLLMEPEKKWYVSSVVWSSPFIPMKPPIIQREAMFLTSVFYCLLLVPSTNHITITEKRLTITGDVQQNMWEISKTLGQDPQWWNRAIALLFSLYLGPTSLYLVIPSPPHTPHPHHFPSQVEGEFPSEFTLVDRMPITGRSGGSTGGIFSFRIKQNFKTPKFTFYHIKP